MDILQVILEFLSGIVAWFTTVINAVFVYLTDTLVTILSDFISWFMVHLTIFSIESKLFFLEISWGVASSVLSQFNIGTTVSSYVSSLSPSVAYVANSMGFFDGLNIILQAAVTNYVMRLMGA